MTRARRRRALQVAAVAALLAPAPLRAQAALTVRSEPARPARGSFAWLVATVDTAQQRDTSLVLRGTFAGQPLHLAPVRRGEWRGLVGIPIDDTIAARGRVELVGRTATVPLDFTLAVTGGDYASERLRVAPAMAEPDSAARERIAREQALARAVGRRAQETPRLWRGPFAAPRPGRITSRYGTARVFNNTVASRHLGTDYAGAVGDPVRAANRGVVALVADFLLAGTVVYLDHGDGLTTGYFHLSRATVAVGDSVRRGQVIGAVGRSGRVTGPHLHWVTRYGTQALDGSTLLAATAAEGPAN